MEYSCTTRMFPNWLDGRCWPSVRGPSIAHRATLAEIRPHQDEKQQGKHGTELIRKHIFLRIPDVGLRAEKLDPATVGRIKILTTCVPGHIARRGTFPSP